MNLRYHLFCTVKTVPLCRVPTHSKPLTQAYGPGTDILFSKNVFSIPSAIHLPGDLPRGFHPPPLSVDVHVGLIFASQVYFAFIVDSIITREIGFVNTSRRKNFVFHKSEKMLYRKNLLCKDLQCSSRGSCRGKLT